ncbi:hypothetical protein D3C87_1229300 [compost metagenome]
MATESLFLMNNVKIVPVPAGVVLVVVGSTLGPVPMSPLSESLLPPVVLVRSTSTPVTADSVSRVDSVLVLSPAEVPMTIVLPPAPGAAEAGSVAASTNFTLPLAGTGPVSGMPSLLLSINGVRPSAAKNLKVVPAGNVLLGVPIAGTARFTMSAALPMLNTVCVNFTVVPAPAVATVVVSATVVLGLPAPVSFESTGLALTSAEPRMMPKVPTTL